MAAHGRHFLVLTPHQEAIHCVTRGKKTDVVCGDRVEIALTSAEQGVIENVFPRSSLFQRADAFRTKPIAANATQVAIVLAPRPSWSEDLLQRCLMAAESQKLPALIIANKADLPDHAATMQTLDLYTRIGYPVISVSAQHDLQPLPSLLHGHLTLLTGQSGMGKSTLINHLLPNAAVRVNTISEALDTGKHTTSDTRLYQLDKQSAVMDSPGFQEFALAHLSQSELESAMPDFRPYLGQCRFRNCVHRHEPGCAILQAVEAGHLAHSRLAFLQRILLENSRRDLY